VVEPYPSEKLLKSVGMMIPNWKNKIDVPNYQPEIIMDKFMHYDDG